MNWKNLKNNKCPKCNTLLTGNLRFIKCPDPNCDFICSVQKFNGIIRNIYKPKETFNRNYEENLSELNNLEL